MLSTGSNGQIPKSKSTATLNNVGDAAADAAGTLDKDLSRSLQSLQQRVVSLERSLAPYATPFQVPSIAASTGAGPFMEPGLSMAKTKGDQAAWPKPPVDIDVKVAF